mmetsp:Transcript_93/g.298  ORF Transcript_93/g.298 Transcript_93/m.298 type:complete len:201 (-) Transcript_93:437-1039(-)
MYYMPIFKKLPDIKFVTPLLTEIVPSFVGTFELLLGSKRTRNRTMSAALRWTPGEYTSCWLMLFGLLATIAYVASHSSVLQATLPFLVAGVLFYVFSQVSHINDDSFQPPPSQEWAAAQIMTTQGDYAYASEFWNRMSIGLNNQALHHLFPSVHQCHYPALAKLIKPTFEKHNLPTPGWSQTISQAFAKHLAHMDMLNAF